MPLHRGGREWEKDRRFKKFQRLQQDPLNYLKARDYLVTENYYGPLERILASLNASLATMAFIESAGVFRIIFQADTSSATPAAAATYAKRCTEMILEKWEDIAKWMSYLVVHDTEGITTVDIGNDASPWSAVKCITEAILLLFRSNSNELGVALVSRPCTVTLLVLLLAKVQLGTRKYLLLHLPGSASRCITTGILHTCWALCKAGQDSAVVALVTRSRRSRQTVFTALACRATQLAEETVGINFDVAYAVTLERLVEVVTTLSSRLGEWIYRTNVFSELAAAVDIIAQKAHLADVVDQRCWELLSMALMHLVWAAVQNSQNPLAILPQLVRSGLLRAALICSRRRGTHTSRPKLPFDVDSLYFLVPYLQFESIYSAAEECGGLRDIIDRLTLNASTGYTKPPIWGIVLDERDRSWGTYSSEKRGPFCLCSNVKHADPRYLVGDHPVRACSGCHWVAYCSEQCQREDWRNLHRHECSRVASDVRAHGLIHAKTNLDVRRSQLAHLQSTVNRQSLESLKSQKAGGYLEEACSKMMVFTLSFLSALNGGNLEFRPVHQSQETAEDAGVWKARYLQFFEDASKDEGTLLCEGSFWRTPVLGMRTLVQLRYYADGIAHGRWMIVANMSRFRPHKMGSPISGSHLPTESPVGDLELSATSTPG